MNVRYPQPILLGFFVFGLFGSLGLTFMSSKVEAQTALFLTPPYWGTTYISAVFDHQFPTLYSGTPSDGNAPNGLVNRNGIRYTTGDCSLYSGHAGIDYGLVYNYVIAAHNGKVSQAGWYDPENRRHAFGLMVEIELVSTQRISQHKTIYAHLSTLLVQTGQIVTQQELIAISGNTGSTGGPHLHFEVRKRHTDNIFYAINPYGWVGSKEKGEIYFELDPWQHALGDNTRPASVNLWQNSPAISSGHCSYPTGFPLVPSSNNPLLEPDLTISAFQFMIDDFSSRFQTTGGPWTQVVCQNEPICGDDAYGMTYKYFTRTPQTTGTATWNILSHDLIHGRYDVYAAIPKEHATARLAYYEIHHNGQVHLVGAGIDQRRFNQDGYGRTWAYLGRYTFSDFRNDQRVIVYHEGCDDGVVLPIENGGCGGEGEVRITDDLAADALVLVLADKPNLSVAIPTASSDDAGTKELCNYSTNAPEVAFGYCNNGNASINGFRFTNVTIPAHATITRAHLQFTVDGSNRTEVLNLQIFGEKVIASATFSNSNNGRPEHRLNNNPTAAWVAWPVPNTVSWSIGQERFSPNIAPIVQEIVDIQGWAQGPRTLTFIVKPANNTGQFHRPVLTSNRPYPSSLFENPPYPRLLVWYEECPSEPCPMR